VFAAHAFSEGETLLRFAGRRVRGTPPEATGRQDRYVQIGPDEYLGPSGRVDDLINHSCDPNTGLRFDAVGIHLVALRPIEPGEEVTWDYSTTLSGSHWRMPCDCRAPSCRGLIGNFDSLPAERQAWFRDRDLVAPYLREEVAPEVVRAA
jgi:hypothetical protein